MSADVILPLFQWNPQKDNDYDRAIEVCMGQGLTVHYETKFARFRGRHADNAAKDDHTAAPVHAAKLVAVPAA